MLETILLISPSLYLLLKKKKKENVQIPITQIYIESIEIFDDRKGKDFQKPWQKPWIR